MEKERFEQAEIEEYRRGIPLWFLVGCIALSAWVIYYLVKYWGGLGPGIGY